MILTFATSSCSPLRKPQSCIKASSCGVLLLHGSTSAPTSRPFLTARTRAQLLPQVCGEGSVSSSLLPSSRGGSRDENKQNRSRTGTPKAHPPNYTEAAPSPMALDRHRPTTERINEGRRRGSAWPLADRLGRPCPVQRLLHGLRFPVLTHAARNEALLGLERRARRGPLGARAGIWRAEQRSKLGASAGARATYLCNTARASDAMRSRSQPVHGVFDPVGVLFLSFAPGLAQGQRD